MQTYTEATLSKHEGHAIWAAMLNDVKGLRLTTPTLGLSLAKLSVFFILFACALWFCWLESSWLGLTAAYIAIALLLAQFAFIGHDAGHGSLSRNTSMNVMFGQLSMTLITGLAFEEWIGRHRSHHK